MALIAMVSAKHSPGTSTAALACTLAWPVRTLLAECDPAGGDVLAGYLGRLDIAADRGLLALAKADLRDQLADLFWGQLIDLDAPHRRRLVLPGITDPAQAATVRDMWPRLAALFAELEYADPGYDVIADCGRLSGTQTPWSVLARAELVLLALRPTSLRTVSPAVPAVSLLRRQLTDAAGNADSLGLLLIGSGDYHRREIEQGLGAPVVIQLPDDRRTAEALNGTGSLRRGADLIRHAASAHEPVRAAVDRHRARPRPRTRQEVHYGR
jgi:hypothetical protein